MKCIENNKQEVIECTGGLNYQSHFIIEYGNENGLKSKQNPDYPYQACGVCCLTDGTPIGGVRHQMKDTETGVKNQAGSRISIELTEISASTASASSGLRIQKLGSAKSNEE